MSITFGKVFGAGIVCALLIPAIPAKAQFGGINPTGVNAAFIKLFGPHTNFSARVDVQVLDKSGKNWVRMPAKIAALDEKLRLDIDMGQIVSKDLPEFALNSLKQSGLAQISSIVRPDKKATFMVFPGAQSYLNLALSAEDALALRKGYKVESTTGGTEKLAGKERTRNIVVIKEPSGSVVLKATTWLAPELKNFPVQIETRQDNMTVILKFADVQFARPAASQFELPSGFAEYQDMQKMMLGIMKKMVSEATGT